MVFMPRSPRRLLSLGRRQEAERALRWLRGKHYDTNAELNIMQVYMQWWAVMTYTCLSTALYSRVFVPDFLECDKNK